MFHDELKFIGYSTPEKIIDVLKTLTNDIDKTGFLEALGISDEAVQRTLLDQLDHLQRITSALYEMPIEFGEPPPLDKFLNKLKLIKLLETLKSNEVHDLETLVLKSKGDLKAMGITLGPAVKITRAIEKREHESFL